jgi:16S rRNA (guanine(527)-N(7))-methyltransferase RsmG
VPRPTRCRFAPARRRDRNPRDFSLHPVRPPPSNFLRRPRHQVDVAGAQHDPLVPLADAIRVVTGRAASAAERERFSRYLDLLLVWNRTHRMTALSSPAAIGRILFQDSLLMLPLLPGGGIKVVDIGAGAGIPGVPLRIVEPRIQLTLIEARRKRVSFLSSLKRELDLSDVEILEGRAEDIVKQHPEKSGVFDVAICRAIAQTRSLLVAIASYLKPRGVFIAPGPPRPGKLPVMPPTLVARWEMVPFPGLGLKRSFLIARRNP